ncbi:MAG: tRNA (N6-isopentenyl adenosine(37)-C2)-methylthiotransferase MiaB [Desulfovibrionaceae bacterium]|nr:tRNA (N6-isopentenyl adenosine(37)-C2)-methylthiotransferase MiaB [Desulfovibrionaceae bacterium]
MPAYHLLTFGCQMNINDSFWLSRSLKAHGFTEVTLEEAEIVLINTCAVREKPEQKVLSTLQRIKALTKDHPKILVGVLGCVAQQLGSKLMQASSQVRLVAGPDALAQIPKILERLLVEPNLTLSLLDFTTHYQERERDLTTPMGPSAYVNIMQGCDNFCTYCIVPYTRGRQKSRTKEAILKECQEKIALGAKEITLLGQNVNAFGQDKAGDGTRFFELIASLNELKGLERLRYTSPHPKDMTNEDILAFKTCAKLCPSLHLPLQSGSSKVLKRMARGYDREYYLHLVARLKEACPSIALTTDIIVGFPGETREDLEDTLSLMESLAYMSSFSFCYSDRQGCPAVKFLDKIPKEEQHLRLNLVQNLQEELTAKWLAQRKDQITTILLDSKSPRSTPLGTSWQGRDPYGTLVHLTFQDDSDHTGEMVKVKISQVRKHCLIGETLPLN